MAGNPYEPSDATVSPASTTLPRRTPIGIIAIVFVALLCIGFLRVPFCVKVANSITGSVDWWGIWFSVPVRLRPLVQTIPVLPAILYGSYHVVRFCTNGTPAMSRVAIVFVVAYSLVFVGFVVSWWPYL